jgi:hypothetical protein
LQDNVPLPSSVRTNYPAALEGIVMRALERDVRARYHTARDLYEDLEQFARQNQLSTSPMSLSTYVKELFAFDETTPATGVTTPDIASVSTITDVRDTSLEHLPQTVPFVRKNGRLVAIAMLLGMSGAVVALRLMKSERQSNTNQLNPTTMAAPQSTHSTIHQELTIPPAPSIAADTVPAKNEASSGISEPAVVRKKSHLRRTTPGHPATNRGMRAAESTGGPPRRSGSTQAPADLYQSSVYPPE